VGRRPLCLCDDEYSALACFRADADIFRWREWGQSNGGRAHAQDWSEHTEGRKKMAGPAKPGNTDSQEQSLGDLVALAVSDVTQLVKFEVDLAKIELKEDARRIGIGGVLLGMAAFVGCLVLMLLCFAYAYGLIAAGIWAWAAFLIVAGTCILLAALAVAIGLLTFRRLTGLRKTRSTVSDDLALIRRDDAVSSAGH
jgi:uncharacterized membrane protein YqjE